MAGLVAAYRPGKKDFMNNLSFPQWRSIAPPPSLTSRSHLSLAPLCHYPSTIYGTHTLLDSSLTLSSLPIHLPSESLHCFLFHFPSHSSCPLITLLTYTIGPQPSMICTPHTFETVWDGTRREERNIQRPPLWLGIRPPQAQIFQDAHDE